MARSRGGHAAFLSFFESFSVSQSFAAVSVVNVFSHWHDDAPVRCLEATSRRKTIARVARQFGLDQILFYWKRSLSLRKSNKISRSKSTAKRKVTIFCHGAASRLHVGLVCGLVCLMQRALGRQNAVFCSHFHWEVRGQTLLQKNSLGQWRLYAQPKDTSRGRTTAAKGTLTKAPYHK